MFPLGSLFSTFFFTLYYGIVAQLRHFPFCKRLPAGRKPELLWYQSSTKTNHVKVGQKLVKM